MLLFGQSINVLKHGLQGLGRQIVLVPQYRWGKLVTLVGYSMGWTPALQRQNHSQQKIWRFSPSPSEEPQAPGSPGMGLISGKIVAATFIIIGVTAAPRDPSWDWGSFFLAMGKEGLKEGPCKGEAGVWMEKTDNKQLEGKQLRSRMRCLPLPAATLDHTWICYHLSTRASTTSLELAALTHSGLAWSLMYGVIFRLGSAGKTLLEIEQCELFNVCAPKQEVSGSLR